jgi:hypothetical protein
MFGTTPAMFYLDDDVWLVECDILIRLPTKRNMTEMAMQMSKSMYCSGAWVSDG